MLPITNQTARIRTNNKDGKGSYYQRQDRTKQVKPYNLPAKYLSHNIVVHAAMLYQGYPGFNGIANAGASKGICTCGPDTPGWLTSYRQRALNGAYTKFKDAMHDEAMLAVNFREREQALKMCLGRAGQLLEFTRALARRDLKGVCDALRISPERVPPHLQRDVFRTGSYRRGTRRIVLKKEKRRKYQGTKGYANAWLEFHFGWEPLVHDIYACVDLLQQPLPDHMVTAVGPKVRFDLYDRKLFNARHPLYESYELREQVGWARGKIGGILSIHNPDAYLANRLGLVNPASIAWEFIPFSFVIDWFVNVSDFLGQWTDWIGVKLTNSWNSWVIKVDSCTVSRHYSGRPGSYGYEIAMSSVHSQRQMGTPDVTLALRPPKRLSSVRAATAIALLVQLLPGGFVDNPGNKPKIHRRLSF